MRTISLVDRIEFDYQGNLFSKAITAGDVDNDKRYEIVVGNVNGDVNIYKGSDSKPWARAAGLGMIMCLEIGDACNHGMTPDGEEATDTSRLLKPVHRQHLDANSKVVLIADIDGDGFCEVVIGYTDRRVRAYKWKEEGQTLPNTPLVPGSSALQGKFVLLESWSLAGQIGSMTVNKRPDGLMDVMVSQPGGTFVTLLGKNTCHTDRHTAEEVVTSEPCVVYHPLGSARARNPGVTTEVVGNISRRKHGEDTHSPNYSAICTLDGTITLVDNDKILWSVYVDHQLFSLSKLDITGDGTEEVVACSWDGQTYMLNLNKDMVRFQFREDVSAFCAGYFSLDKDKNVPCLIYATFNNKIVVYHNIQLKEIGLTNLISKMEEEAECASLLQSLNCDGNNACQLRQLYHWCLYGFHSKNQDTP